jgi:hypothetical protein
VARDRRKNAIAAKAAAKAAKAGTPPPSESKPLSDLEVTREAKEIFALWFEAAGGLQRLLEFTKTNNANYDKALAHYAKTIPLNTVSTVNATVSIADETEARAAFVQAFANVIKARQQELIEAAERSEKLIEAPPNPNADNVHAMAEQILGVTIAPRDGVTIDNGPQSESDPPQVETPNAEPAAPSPPRSSPRLVQSAPRELTPSEAKAKAMEPQPQPIYNEPSTTQLFYESGGRQQPFHRRIGEAFRGKNHHWRIDMNDLEKCELTIKNLENIRKHILQEQSELANERGGVSLAAHTGDKKSRTMLDEINVAAGQFASEFASIESAIVEANKNLAAARAAEAGAADRENALKLRELKNGVHRQRHQCQ